MKKLYILGFLQFLSAAIYSQCCSNGANLLADYNPDFSAPFIDVPPGFQTDNPYTFFPTPGTYIIVPSRNYGACFESPQTDHTTGDPAIGRFLWFDTSPTASQADPDVAWKPFNPSLPPATQNAIAVSPNTTYVFSCYIRDLARNPDCFSGGAPLMGLRINGQEMAEIDLALVTEPCCPQWTYLCTEWNSGNDTLAFIQIESRRNDGFNDLGIDDVYFGTTSAFEFSLGADTTICEGLLFSLESPVEGANNVWSDASQGDSLLITEPGEYWLSLEKDGCSGSDTIEIGISLLPEISLGNDTISCAPEAFTLSPVNTGGIIQAYFWQDNTLAPSIEVSNSGIYSLFASNNCGSSTDSVEIVFFEPPNLGTNQSACMGDTVLLSVGPADSYLWNTGSTNNSIQVTSAGEYWVETTLAQCSGTDSVSLIYFTFPSIDLGADTLICTNQPIELAAQEAINYQWSSGETTASINIEESGVYWVNASNGPCKSVDTVNITLEAIPLVVLGSDLNLCEGDLITLTAGAAESYLWSDGSVDDSKVVGSSGLYWVEGRNENCISRDSILISVLNCTCTFVLAIPNAFTPNNDGFNDVFVPQKAECIEESRLRILNRWGAEVFSTDNLNSGWDGRTKLGEAPDGTYFWLIDYTTTSKDKGTMSGFLDMRRK
jgi:gliding motility-associated-like protein